MIFITINILKFLLKLKIKIKNFLVTIYIMSYLNTIEVLTQELNALKTEQRLNIACDCLNSFVGANFAGILGIIFKNKK